MPFGLYLHIPFCKQKCPYCDFYSRPAGEAVMDAYLAALLGELDRSVAAGEIDHADTVYLGGGTPSLMGAARLAALLEGIGARIPLAADAEITLECNPESTTPSLLRTLRRAGYNRVSFGVQSLDDRELRALGRLHDAMGAKRAVAMAREAGFDNLSVDLMLGIPYQTGETVARFLDWVTVEAIPHLSAYLLKIEPGTPYAAAKLPFADDDTAADFYLQADRRMRAAGYGHYEISNFARPGRESRHNLLYWRCEPYLGLGPSAHSLVDGRRWGNAADLDGYLRGEVRREPEPPGGDADERLMLALRLSEGIDLAAWGERFGRDPKPYLARAARYTAGGLLIIEGSRIHLTPEGMLLSNGILADILWG